jgi:GAF domain-containing protein
VRIISQATGMAATGKAPRSKARPNIAGLEAALRERTAERDELQAQLNATAEVLGVINASPGDLAPVFDALLDKALRLSGAAFGILHTFDGERVDVAAHRGVSPQAFAEFLTGTPREVGANGIFDLFLRGESFVHRDVATSEAYRSGVPEARAVVEIEGARTVLAVPLRKDDTLLGAIVIYRREVRPFSDKQIALLQNFAAQAVIAMENAHLITETREALEQQTATAEVLGVINSSPGLAPVFDAILEKARAVCGLAHGSLNVYDGDYFRTVATHGYPEAFAALLRQPRRTGPQMRFLEGDRIVQITDVAAEIPVSADPIYRAAVEAGVRTVLFVPLRKDRNLLGYLTANRHEVRPFSEKEITLLENFAAQAVIAMENARLITETREALEQQTATAEVLGVINSSPGDLTPVFDAILEKAHSLYGIAFGTLQIYDGQSFRAVATHGLPEMLDRLVRQPYVPEEEGFQRLIGGERFYQIPDLAAVVAQSSSPNPRSKAGVELRAVRTLLFLPLRKENLLLGLISAGRMEVRPFSEKEIARLENFAAQAVIAMENARLLTETRERSRDLLESLEYQTATSDVLKVISRSTIDLQPVLQTLLETAARLCNAAQGGIALPTGEVYRYEVLWSYSLGWSSSARERAFTPGRGTLIGRVLLESGVVHIPDVAADQEYAVPGMTAHSRTLLGVPMLREGQPIGVLVLGRQQIEPFSERQIELVRTFADQAVIAMENARLINETRQALEQQTATAEVLGVINSSPGDLAPVFDAMLEKTLRLCEAAHGNFLTYDGEVFHEAAFRGEPHFAEYRRQHGPLRPAEFGQLARVVQGRGTLHRIDARDSEAYRDDPSFRQMVDGLGIRTSLAVPLRKGDALLGVIRAYRLEVRPFTDKQIALVENFAAQAVIAMENARLLNELRQRTDQVAELNRGLEARVAEQVEELGRVGRLKRFLAPQLAEMIVSQGDEKILESHRREIVVVFCDLRGYTAFTETAEPEEVLDFLGEYHGALGPLVSQFEGTLDQFSGDGIMVFFNDPVPIPDPAERAVRMAIAMRDAAATLIAAWRERGRELGFGAGIAQGYATLGQIGFSERSGYTAIGTVCNVAARLCAEAKDGQILLSQRINAALRGGIETKELGALTLKGLTQPVMAFNVPAVSTNVVAIRPAGARGRIAPDSAS